MSLVSILVGARHRRRRQLSRRPAEQALGPDRESGLQPVRAVDQGAAEPRRAGAVHGVRPRHQLRPLPRPARLVRLRVEERQHRVRGHRPAAGACQAGRSPDGTAPIVVSYKDRVQRITNTDEQDITNALIKLREPAAEEGLFHAGPRRARHGGLGSAWLRHDRRRDRARQLHRREARPGAAEDDAGGRDRRSSSPGPHTDFLEPEVAALKEFVAQGRQGAGDARPAGSRASRSSTNLPAPS